MQTVDMFELLGTKRLEPESIEIVERSLDYIYLSATRATFHGVSPDPSPPHLLLLKAVCCRCKAVALVALATTLNNHFSERFFSLGDIDSLRN